MQAYCALGWNFSHLEISTISYHIELPAEYGHVHYVFHINYLCPHKGPALPQPIVPFPLDDVAAGEYKVENILDSRFSLIKSTLLNGLDILGLNQYENLLNI